MLCMYAMYMYAMYNMYVYILYTQCIYNAYTHTHIYIYVCVCVCIPFTCMHAQSLKLYLTLCNPIDCSMPGFPVFHYLPEFAQAHVC